MPSQVTVTGKIGPGLNMAGQVFNNIRSLQLDCLNAALNIEDSTGKIRHVDISTASTFTVTIANKTYTVVVS